MLLLNHNKSIHKNSYNIPQSPSYTPQCYSIEGDNLIVQRNLFKPNLLRTKFCILNRQVFDLCRLN